MTPQLKPGEAIRVTRDEYPELAKVLEEEGYRWCNSRHKPTEWNPFVITTTAKPKGNEIYIRPYEEKALLWDDIDVCEYTLIPASELLKPKDELVGKWVRFADRSKTSCCRLLTYGKMYKVIQDVGDKAILIIVDSGAEMWINRSAFDLSNPLDYNPDENPTPTTSEAASVPISNRFSVALTAIHNGEHKLFHEIVQSDSEYHAFGQLYQKRISSDMKLVSHSVVEVGNG